jgi:hypothetical protein
VNVHFGYDSHLFPKSVLISNANSAMKQLGGSYLTANQGRSSTGIVEIGFILKYFCFADQTLRRVLHFAFAPNLLASS